MIRTGIVVPLSLVALALLVFAGCGGKGGSNYSTNPGGGGGGAGPTFDFHFPATGTSQSFTFTDTGNWDYHCTPHAGSGMVGAVIVSASATDDSALVQVGHADSLRFFPAIVTIKTGGHVRWVNVSAMTTHTVTRP